VTSIAGVESAPPSRRRERYLKNLLRQCSWLFAIALFGYPMVGNLISVYQIDSRALSVPFRIGVVLFSLWIIATTGPFRIDRWRKLMLLFWFLYILRLIHDWLIPNLDGADYALEFFVATSVLPVLALLKARTFRQRRFALVGFAIAGIGAATSLLASKFGNADVQDVTVSSGRLALSALNSVSLGHLATSAILCGFVLWRGAALRTKLSLSFCFIGLSWCLVSTGSKGPALALLVCIGLWAFRHGQSWKFALLALPVLAWMLVSESNPLAARLSGSEDDPSTLDRIVILSDSFHQIAGSPIVGSAFVELNSGYYPHNIFVEAGLALGIPGAILLLLLMGCGSWRAWKGLKTKEPLLGLLFFQGLIGASISGALFGATLLWVTFAMLPRSTGAVALKGARRQTLRQAPGSSTRP
jgi:hypothetical protein